MPGHGDHYKADTGVAANPFEEPVPRMSEYTAKELATLQSRLDKQLGPEYISSRPGAGGSKVHYIAAEKVINLANEVFGFNGWSSRICNITPDFVDEAPGGKITLGLSVVMRVTLRDGSYHEDIGYGHIENCKGKAAAFEKAKKEAATDALKRALRTFGNILGNCLYDKDYLQKVTKIKIAPSKWDADNLHRHHDFAPATKDVVTKQEAGNQQDSLAQGHSSEFTRVENEDEFGGDVFDEGDLLDGHPDEVTLPPEKPVKNHHPHDASIKRPETPQKSSLQRMEWQQSKQAQSNSSTSEPSALLQQTRTPAQNIDPQTTNSTTAVNLTPASKPHDKQTSQQSTTVKDTRQSPMVQQPHQQATVGFTTSRAADLVNSDVVQSNVTLPPFNPNAESHSIRRTTGVNHNKSEPIKRQSLDGQSNAQQTSSRPVSPNVKNMNPVGQHNSTGNKPNTTNFVNPMADLHRKIGMPNVAGSTSPHVNRGAYKPPGPAPQKRPYAATVGTGDDNATSRPVLADVSNTITAHAPEALVDAKNDNAKRSKIAEDSHG